VLPVAFANVPADALRELLIKRHSCSFENERK
jgi:hypothetical protein